MPTNEVFHFESFSVPHRFTRYGAVGPFKSRETNRRFGRVNCFMKRYLLLALSFAIAGCNDIHIGMGHGFGGIGVKGDGKPKEESRSMGEYDKVEVGSAFQVVAKEGKLAPVEISADSNLLPLIKSEVKNRTLKVWIEGSVSTQSPLKLSLSTPTINGFEASGATRVDLELKSKHDLKLECSGSSELKVNGEIVNLDCDLSGASHIDLSAPSLGKLNTTLSGASGLNFSGSVDRVVAELSGASNIKGGMHGNSANVRLSGASNGQFGKFGSVEKNLSGASNVSFGN